MLASSLDEGRGAFSFQSRSSDDIKPLNTSFSAYLLQRIASTQSDSEDDDTVSALELDSHADSPVVGRKAFIIRRTDPK